MRSAAGSRGRHRLPRWISTTPSRRSSSACPRCRPRSPSRPSSAPAGAASSPTPASCAASAPTTGSPSASSLEETKISPSASSWARGTPPRRSASSCACHEGGGGGAAGRNDRVWEFFGCRHGRVVLASSNGYYDTRQILVWNPVTGEDHLLGVPQFSDSNHIRMQATVICASGDSGPFKLALAWEDRRSNAHICVYSSETGVWGNVASAAIQPSFTVGCGNVMVGNTLYWILFGNGTRVCILEFDLDSQDLYLIEVPPAYKNHRGIYLCTLAKGGGLSLMVMSEDLRGQLWVWEKTTEDPYGVFSMDAWRNN